MVPIKQENPSWTFGYSHVPREERERSHKVEDVTGVFVPLAIEKQDVNITRQMFSRDNQAITSTKRIMIYK
jgi:hypothetical protein